MTIPKGTGIGRGCKSLLGHRMKHEPPESTTEILRSAERVVANLLPVLADIKDGVELGDDDLKHLLAGMFSMAGAISQLAERCYEFRVLLNQWTLAPGGWTQNPDLLRRTLHALRVGISETSASRT